MVDVKKATLDKNGLAKTAGSLTVYNYDPLTGLFMGESDEFLAQGVGIPANSTSSVPPDAAAGKVIAYTDGSWKLIDDHRGETVYFTDSGLATEITQAGDYPPGTTVLAPLTVFDVWNGEAWETDTAAQQAAAVNGANAEKAARIAEANSITQAWQTQLMLGIITDDDKALLTRWMQYIQAVQAVDVSTAPDVDWPAKPE